MEEIIEYKDLQLFKFATAIIEKKVEDSAILTEAIVIEAVEKIIDFPLIEDNSKKFKNEIIDSLIDYFWLAIEKNSIDIKTGTTIVDPKDHVDWDVKNSYYWNKIHLPLITESYKEKDPKSYKSIIASIDHESSRILSLMEDPVNRDKFDSKGLVIGYVQSGKTANFTALAAKALDSGYKLIVVLGGMHNSLRVQTQNRLNAELLGYDDYESDSPSALKYYKDPLRKPRRVTTSNYIDKFEVKQKGEFVISDRLNEVIVPGSKYSSCVAVIKKNSTVLANFNKWVDQCPASELKKIPLLIIDDEADQASIDANYLKTRKKLEKTKKVYKKSELNEEATKINKHIKSLIDKFKKSAYVGYTATPFANVFIDPDDLYKNLYPINYIHMLPKPKAYFGAAEIFGDPVLRSAYVVSDKVGTKKENIAVLKTGVIPESLENAIFTFLICFAIRIVRKEGRKSMSMLIHINHKNQDQDHTLEAVKKRVKNIKKVINYKTKQGDIFRNKLERQYDKVKSNGIIINEGTGSKTRTFSTFEKILKVLKDNIDQIELKKVNGDSDDELDYVKNPSMKVIAIGGNKLSRGLTLDGLMVSYFLRDSNRADTLMQMGRFFGYRSGYNDVMRIFTTEQLVADFGDLIETEDKLRDEVDRYVEEGVTPKKFAPAVKAMSRMMPSGKMGNAQLNRRSFGSSESSTFYFKLKDTKLLNRNMKSAVDFVNDLKKSKIKLDNSKIKNCKGKIFREVDTTKVIDFLSSIEIGSNSFNKENLIEYFEKNNVSSFNIGIPTKLSGEQKDFGTIGKFGLVVRSRFKIDEKPPTADGYYNLGSLSSGQDRVMDLDQKDDKRILPLILLYRVDKNSEAKDLSKTREDLFDGIKSKTDLLGLSIITPESSVKIDNLWENVM